MIRNHNLSKIKKTRTEIEIMRKRLLDLHKIDVFVSGSTALSHELDVVLSAISQWNSTESLSVHIDPIQFEAYTYHNFQNDQKLYDEHIKNKADLFFLILVDGIGDKTRKEFDIAYEGFKSSKNKPDICVFSHNDSSDIGVLEIRRIIEKEDRYYVKFSTHEELGKSIEPVLRKYAADRIKEIENEKKKIVNCEKEFRKKVFGCVTLPFLIFSCTLLFSFGIFWFGWSYPKKKAIKQAQEVIDYCDKNGNPSVCLDRLLNAKNAMESVGISNDDPIYDEVIKRINNL